MNKSFIKIRSAGTLDVQLNRRIQGRIEKRREQVPGYEERLNFALRTRLATLRLVDHLRFKVYHRQFEGGATILVPTTVRTARMVVKGLNRVRKIWN